MSFLKMPKFDLSPGESLFNEPLYGGSMIPVGSHETKLNEISVNDSGTSLVTIFENEDGQTLKEYIYLMDYNKKDRPSFKLVSLLGALLGSPSKGLEFLHKVNQDPNLLQSLVGLKVSIDVVKGERGYTVAQDPADPSIYRIVDAGKGTASLIIEEFCKDVTFSSFAEAGEWVKEHNDTLEEPENKLYRAYPYIKSFGNSQEGAEFNATAIQNIVSTDASGSKPKSSATDSVFN